MGPSAVTSRVRLTPTDQSGFEGWLVHMEALGHRLIPWDQLPDFHQRRLEKRVRRLRHRLNAGAPVQVSYGTAPAWSTALAAGTTRWFRGARARGAGRPAARARTVRGDGGDSDASGSSRSGEPSDPDKPPDVDPEPGGDRAFRRSRAPPRLLEPQHPSGKRTGPADDRARPQTERREETE